MAGSKFGNGRAALFHGERTTGVRVHITEHRITDRHGRKYDRADGRPLSPVFKGDVPWRVAAYLPDGKAWVEIGSALLRGGA